MVICRLWTSIRSGQMSSRPEILEPLSSMLLTIITSSMGRQLARMRLKLFLSRVVGTTLATAQRRITLLTVRSHFAAGGVPNSRRPFCAFGKSYSPIPGPDVTICGSEKECGGDRSFSGHRARAAPGRRICLGASAARILDRLGPPRHPAPRPS